MLFNSIEFLLFLPVLFSLYWYVFSARLHAQNILILVASYIFYGWWDYRFLSLIALSTVVDYIVGLQIFQAKNSTLKKRWVLFSVLFNLGILGFFKYYNFFASSLQESAQSLGIHLDVFTLQVILPVGISFYTFQTMSYSLDIYKGKLSPAKNFIEFSAFVAFFPQLVAGPIERALNLLPQFSRRRVFSYDQAIEGVRLILWGFFKKIVIADALAPAVNEIFANYGHYSSGTLILGAIYFAFQIYCDFSGYSDIARGLAKLLGFELMVNFNFPYFSRGISEFWRKWHISLSTWFRDYLYVPLGGSRVGRMRGISNIFIIFIVSGFWHGANWTFILWGGLHALLFIPSFILGTNRQHMGPLVQEGAWMPTARDFLGMLSTFVLVCIAWVFFRADSIHVAFDYLNRIVTVPGWDVFHNPYDQQSMCKENLILGVFVALEYLLAIGKLQESARWPILNYLTDVVLLVCILISLPVSQEISFIYFQF